MRIKLILATLGVVGLMGGTGVQSARADGEATSNDVVAGVVTKVDPATNTVAVRSADGATHEFKASKETISNFKVGDRIEAKKRSDPK